jgi:membrane glycosyltransferase
VDKALREGPDALGTRHKMHLLNDPVAFSRLHFEVWVSAEAHPAWRDSLSLIPDRLSCTDVVS